MWRKKQSRLPEEVEAVAGTLLARQSTLACQLAGAPSIWNGNSAPLFIEAMAVVQLSLSWILKDPICRSQAFLADGLDREQRYLNQRWSAHQNSGNGIDLKPQLEALGSWIDQQHGLFPELPAHPSAIPSFEQMAEESDGVEFYRYFLSPFSACRKSTWEHLGRYHLKLCGNPDHPFHVVPAENSEPEDHYLVLALRCLKATVGLVENYLTHAATSAADS
ncbi:MAG: hypothetical protein ACT4OM_09550 [Actinomycetota bacterium]